MSKSVRHAYKGGGGVDIAKYVHEKSHTLLSMATAFIAVLKSTCYDYFPVTRIFTVFLSMVLLIGYFKAFLLEMGCGVLDGKDYVRNGWRS